MSVHNALTIFTAASTAVFMTRMPTTNAKSLRLNMWEIRLLAISAIILSHPKKLLQVRGKPQKMTPGSSGINTSKNN